ncbi:MAG: ABC transporter permease [Pirellulales bacterium]|nr:ABC transporter permease [Pirellulales bacterium]
MKTAVMLALANARRRPARLLLTTLAMIAASALVVWTVSGYDALVSGFDEQTTEYLGRYDYFLSPNSDESAPRLKEWLTALADDPDVEAADPVLQATVEVRSDKQTTADGPPTADRSGAKNVANGSANSNAKSPAPSSPRGRRGGPVGRRRGMSFGGPTLVGARAALPPYELLEGTWIDQDPNLRNAAISQQSAEQLQVGLGDEVLVIAGTKEYRLTIIGIVAQPQSAPSIPRPSPTGRPMMVRASRSMGPATSALYVPLALAEKIAQRPGEIDLVSVKLRSDTNAADFQKRWLDRWSKAKADVALVGEQQLHDALESGFMAASIRKQAWAATGLALLAALFIAFTTLSMGVAERVRQLAMLRAIGLSRGQIAMIVLIESLVLALLGWAGGLAAGWGVLTLVAAAKPDLFRMGASLGGWCVALSGLSALGGALAAAIWPAWRAASVQPLEAMVPHRPKGPSHKQLWFAAAIGVLLIAVNPLLVFVLPIGEALRYGVHAAIGCTSMAIGFLLVAPLAIVAAERLLGPALARLLRLEPRLLSAQLSGNRWRAAGAALALTVGLGLYVSMMVWGYSMLGPFTPGDWTPDMLVAFQRGGLPDAELEPLRQTPGVIADQFVPLAVEQPRLTSDLTDSERGNSVTRQDNVILIGLDPQVAFGGSNPLIAAQFTDGDPQTAIVKLKQGRHCIVPDHFLAATGLQIGDRISMLPPDKPEQPVEYTIAGAVALPGWHWMTKFSGLRRRHGRAAAMVFAGYDDVRRDFDIRQTNFCWMNIDSNANADQIAAAMRPIADRNLGPVQPVNGQGTWEYGATMFGDSLRVSTPQGVRERIMLRAGDMIWAMCQLPLLTLLITSLGVANTIAASVRARRWELGVWRAIGGTRSAVARSILAEGLLIGLVACLISLAFGVLEGWCGTGVSQYVSFFGGLETPLVVPWSRLASGLGAAILLCLLAALWPAYSTSRSEPLTLLQQGRAMM